MAKTKNKRCCNSCRSCCTTIKKAYEHHLLQTKMHEMSLPLHSIYFYFCTYHFCVSESTECECIHHSQDDTMRENRMMGVCLNVCVDENKPFRFLLLLEDA